MAGVIEVTTSVTNIFSGAQFVSVYVKNEGPAVVYLGNDDTVTADQSSTGGYPLAPGQELPSAMTDRGSETFSLYGITAEGSANVSYLGF